MAGTTRPFINHEDVIAQMGLHWDEQLATWRSPLAGGPLGTPFRVVVAFAVECAAPIIEDGAATDEELVDLLPIAVAALQLPGTVEMTDEQIEAIARCAELGAEYMVNNHYAEDPDFPEQAHLARHIGDTRAEQFAYSLRVTFGRRWNDDAWV